MTEWVQSKPDKNYFIVQTMQDNVPSVAKQLRQVNETGVANESLERLVK